MLDSLELFLFVVFAAPSVAVVALLFVRFVQGDVLNRTGGWDDDADLPRQ